MKRIDLFFRLTFAAPLGFNNPPLSNVVLEYPVLSTLVLKNAFNNLEENETCNLYLHFTFDDFNIENEPLIKNIHFTYNSDDSLGDLCWFLADRAEEI
jgi:hypothetical protein